MKGETWYCAIVESRDPREVSVVAVGTTLADVQRTLREMRRALDPWIEIVTTAPGRRLVTVGESVEREHFEPVGKAEIEALEKAENAARYAKPPEPEW